MLKINFHIYYFITSFLSFNLTLFFYYPSFAQSGNLPIKNYPFRAFEVKEQTVGTQNWAATQDKRGVMYFGNNGEGVLEYDGNSWRMIPVSNRNTVASLAADTNGRIYVGGVSEFGYLKPDSSGIMTYVSLTDYLKAEDKKFSNIWHIHIIDSSVYFQARTKLFCLSNLNDLPSKVNIKVINPKTGFHTSYYVHKKLFVRQQGIGLMQLQNDTLAEIPSGEQFANNPIYTMLPFDNNRILISTRNSGLFIYDGMNAIPFPTEADKFLNEKIIYTGTMLPDSSFALGTATGGIAVIDRRGNFKYIIDKASGLLNNMVRGFFVDREGDLWIALNNGISKAEISLPFFKFNEESGLEGSVYDILRHKDKLYIATSQGLKYYDDDFFKQVFYKERIGNTLLNALPVQGIKLETWSLLKFNDIVLAGSSDGIFVVDGNIGTGIAKQYQSVLSLIRSTLDSTIVYAAVKNGLAVLRYNNERWDDLGRIKNLTEEIRSLVETPDGYVWTGSNSQGVMRIDFRQGYTPDPVIDKFDTSDGLPENVWTYVFSVAGNITIDSEKGFYRLVENTDLSKNKKEYFIPDSVLGSEFAGGASYVKLLKEEVNGNVWMYCKKGLGKAIRKDDGTYQWDFQTFKSIDDPFTFTLFPDKNNLAWIGGKNGMICYNEKINKNRDLSFNALIRKVTTTNDSIIFGGSFYDEKWLSVSSKNKLLKPVLDYADNVLRFEYSAPFFNREELSGFQYYLEGFDKDWSEWTLETKKEYTNLHEGNYKFRVRAKNIYGHDSNEATYEFTILAPWYRTLWAYSGYILLFLGFVYAVVRISIFRLKKAKKRLEKIIKQSTAEIIEQKNSLEKAYNELSDKNIELSKAHNEIKEKNKDITDSINYARGIQNSVLTTEEMVRKLFPDSFVLVLPKDIVSGDFYHASLVSIFNLLSMADCTGHGVPGAMLTMVCNDMLNQTVTDRGITTAGEVLDEMYSKLDQVMHRSGEIPGKASHDGMDIGFIAVNTETGSIEFSGSHRQLIVVGKNGIREYKGEKLTISGARIDKNKRFTTQKIEADNNDMLYIFTDGITDQFGGPKNKKFGMKRLYELLLRIHTLDPQEQKQIILEEFQRWQGDLIQTDDVSIIGIRVGWLKR